MDLLTSLPIPLQGPPRVLASIAEWVPVVDADESAPVVDELFRRDLSLPSVVALDGDRRLLISRGRFEQHMAGRLGFGRAVHANRSIRPLLPARSLELPPDTTLPAAAAAAVLQRPSGERYDDLLVAGAASGGRAAVVGLEVLLEALAMHFAAESLLDPLTRIGNRTLLSNAAAHLGSELGAAGVVLIDLDHFKAVNDSLGHAAGDQVLVEYARRLATVATDGALPVRLGGDEFAVLVPRCGDGRLAQVAAAAHRAAHEPIPASGTTVRIGASVGMSAADDAAVGTDPQRDLHAMLSAADSAVYRGKRAGRGRVVDAASSADDLHAGRLGRRVAEAVRSGELPRALSLVYQPIRHLSDGRVIAAEALTRWHDTELGTVRPDALFRELEHGGGVVPVSRWVLQRACAELAAVDPADVPTVSVNISPVHLLDPGFVGDVVDALGSTGLPASRLCLEITESAAITDEATASAALVRLRSLGVRIALDDFGTGFSSLTLLRSLPHDVVKIDRSFTARADTDADDAELVRFVTGLAHRLGKHTCAEGVETEAQLDLLAELGCDSAQGWLLGRPGALSALVGDRSALVGDRSAPAAQRVPTG